VNLERVQTASEMKDAVLRAFPAADIVIMAAAVSDFQFKEVRPQKLKKESLGGTVEIERTPDILSLLGKKRKHQYIVGFAAETQHALAHAREKMAAKGTDLMVANIVGGGKGFEADENEVQILGPSGKVYSTPCLSKREISQVILDRIEEGLAKKRR
jgi:phosphopantothenoylcysteine decarboxylase/phosphopantothenate--cysteine ligase